MELILPLEGQIDASNVDQWEERLRKVLSEASEVKLDAGKLLYISSAGLRLLLRLRKELGKPLPVLNASPEVYDIFEVMGFTELLEVHQSENGHPVSD